MAINDRSVPSCTQDSRTLDVYIHCIDIPWTQYSIVGSSDLLDSEFYSGELRSIGLSIP